ncbi:MAG: selenocysteine-specific translation elongation factor, partial [Candidatus Eisenbacteria bacterium]
VGTAGHIDHGKTALVRRLTGVDTDRLKEEKERGISIDLGFAPWVLDAETTASVVDVPGHRKFVHTMIAGASGIEAVLLVVAADEGVMPQTREHFAIVKLLGIPRGLVVLTKSDLVTDDDWWSEVERDVRALVEGSFLEDAPVVRFSATTGAGAPELLAALDAALEGGAERSETEPARLPVDRVFIVEGFGTVVTGTLWRGKVAVGDTVAVEPAGRTARVRSVEVHGAPVEAAVAGQRTAIALHGLARDDVARGDWVLAPGSLAASTLVTARIDLLPDVAKELKQRARVRFHLGSAEALARVVLLEGDELLPGDSAFAQFLLETPVVPARGDRFVFRAYSPMRTLGGGTVLEPAAQKRKRGDVRGLDVTERGDATARVAQALAQAATTPRRDDELAKALELAPAVVAVEVDRLVADGEARRLPDGRALALAGFAAAGARLREELVAYAKAYPLRFGPGRGELKSRLARELDGPLFDVLLADLLAAGTLVLRGERVSEAPGRELTGKHAEAATRLLAALESGGYAPAEVATLLPPLGLAPAEAIELVGRLLADGHAVRIDPAFVWSRPSWDRAVAFVRARFDAGAVELAVGDVKDGLGISRKWAVPLLEALDREGITRREGNARTRGPVLGG